MSAKVVTARDRAATMLTPVKRKTADSASGQTGRAAAGLKSPGTYQWPRWKWRMAASPYQPSSVYLDQSIQGERLGKSARRWTACRRRKKAATASRQISSHRPAATDERVGAPFVEVSVMDRLNAKSLFIQ